MSPQLSSSPQIRVGLIANTGSVQQGLEYNLEFRGGGQSPEGDGTQLGARSGPVRSQVRILGGHPLSVINHVLTYSPGSVHYTHSTRVNAICRYSVWVLYHAHITTVITKEGKAFFSFSITHHNHGLPVPISSCPRPHPSQRTPSLLGPSRPSGMGRLRPSRRCPHRQDEEVERV